MKHIYLSPAKTNLYLAIGPQQPDGYHTLASCFSTLQLHDTLELSITPISSSSSVQSNQPTIIFKCNHPALQNEREKNLVVRAAKAFLNTCQISKLPIPPISIILTLKKITPMQAGMGGGSSNAATTLLAFNQHPDLPTLSHSQLITIAQSLGADVPFFIGPETNAPINTVIEKAPHSSHTLAWGSNRGDVLTPIPESPSDITHPLPNWPILIVQPNTCKISTPKAFQAWAMQKKTPCEQDKTSLNESLDDFLNRTDHQRQQFQALFTQTKPPSIQQLEALIHNDFESILFPQYPILQKIAEAMKTLGIQRPFLSGSGSAMIGILPVTLCNALQLETEPTSSQTVLNHEISSRFSSLDVQYWVSRLGNPDTESLYKNPNTMIV